MYLPTNMKITLAYLVLPVETSATHQLTNMTSLTVYVHIWYLHIYRTNPVLEVRTVQLILYSS